jgi:hypothetical protein
MRVLRFLVALVVAISGGVVGAAAVSAAAAPTITCSGGSAVSPTPINPGNYASINVSGICFMPGGTVNVKGNLTIGPSAALIANAGAGGGMPELDGILNVGGNVLVGKGATLLMGCAPSFGCTMRTNDLVKGSVIGDGALGLLMHGDAIKGNFTIKGGGGQDFACAGLGIFAAFKSPVYSTFEDGSVGGNVTITGYRSCWLGLTRTYVGGSVAVNHNALGDFDGSEILSNHINGNLACFANMFVDTSKTPAVFTLHNPWDSADTTFGALFPRTWFPNTIINGKRMGQCKVAPALTVGGTSPGLF